ncbi:MAG TPA: UDP-N-acetylmuramoyl-L-alanine--D-glutamate ligase [Candidatus Limnocylindria bacterium]|nr:UDP-N-acetylmuramoyl-L-alanine--D-glutamate ligase [Candidatus Limnocylindria bacterium]
MTPTPARPISSVADLAGREALVLGLARSGVAAARFLSDAGAHVTVYDRRAAGELAEGVAALEGRHVALELGVAPERVKGLLAAADLIVTSPSVSSRFPTTDPWLRAALAAAEERGVEVVSEVGLFLALTRARICGVTGTKGKTTTAALLGEILAGAGVPHVVGGNIGRPLVDEVERLGPDTWVVLELSELQLPTIRRGAELAVYTNIGADHLDRHGTQAAYRAVKARLAELSVEHGTIVLNRDDPGCLELGERLGGAHAAPDIAWYGVDRPGLGLREAWLDEGWVTVAAERLLPWGEVPLPGRHMLANVLAASLAATLLGVGGRAIADGIRRFRGVPHRLEPLGEVDGVRYVNDSMATIPAAAIAAVEAFGEPGQRRVVVIAGGQGKGLDLAPFADAVAERCRAAVLLGETADELEALLAGRVRTERADDMDDAVGRAAALAVRGDAVVLAPAAASFDRYPDYAARGDDFRRAVERLHAERSAGSARGEGPR